MYQHSTEQLKQCIQKCQEQAQRDPKDSSGKQVEISTCVARCVP